MNKELANKLDEIIAYIKNSPDYHKYFQINEQLKKNANLIAIINDIKHLQKQAVKYHSLNQFKEEHKIDQQITIKLQLLETYPIYIEYITLQEELNDMLQNIKTILDKYFYDITN